MKVAEMGTVFRALRACLRRYRRMSLGCCLVLTLAAPAYAIEGPFRVSQFDGAVQIWFEAEHFDERIPDTDDFFPIVDADGALSGKAMTRAGGAGGCVRWDFDISEAEGEAGTWYMWARVVNPNNRSDYLLVEGDPEDILIPAVEPYPGGKNTSPFVDSDDRAFEPPDGDCAVLSPEYVDCTWAWIGGDTQGHIKELHDGVNSMFLFHREGDERRLVDVIMWTDSIAYQPKDEHYEEADEFVDVPPDRRVMFHRGDTDADGVINITDAVSVLNFLFSGGPDTTCKETQDFDNDGAVVITDAVAILGFLFGSGPPPPAPGPTTEPCGRDPDAQNTPADLGCIAYTGCP